MNDKVYFSHSDNRRSLLQVDTIILGVCNQASPKYPESLRIFAISPEKHGG